MIAAGDSAGVDLGYSFTVDLCAAIERSIDEAAPLEFDYLGIDLSQAVARQLFVDLVNDLNLRERYGECMTGGRLERLVVDTDVKRRTASRLLGPTARVEVARAPWRRGAARALDRVAGPWVRPRGQPAARRCGTLFVIHSPKFVRFAEPLLGGADEPLVLFTAYDLGPRLSELSVPGLPLDAWPIAARRRPPLVRDLSFLVEGAERLAAALDALRPRRVVVFEGNHPLDEATNRLARARGIPCLCVQHGWSPIVHNGFRRMTYDAMLVWGEGFAELLAPYNPGQVFVPTGSPALDGIEPRPASRPTVVFFAQGPSQLLSQAHLDDFLGLLEDAAAASPEVEIAVREHPSAPLSSDAAARIARNANVRFAPPDQVPLADLLATAHVTVSIYSTTVLESIALLVPPVVYNATSLPRFVPDVDALGAGIEVRSREGALTALDGLLGGSERARLEAGMRDVRRRFFADADGRAVERVLTCIEAGGPPCAS